MIKVSNIIKKGYTNCVRPALVVLGIGYLGTNALHSYANKMTIDREEACIQHHVTSDVFKKIGKGVGEKSRNIYPLSIFPFDDIHKDLWVSLASKVREKVFSNGLKEKVIIPPDTLLNLLKK